MDASVIQAAQFAAMDKDRWRALVEKALKGAGFESLESVSDDGLRYGPVYPRRKDAATILRSDPARPWTIAQRIDDPDAVRAADQAADDIANGADGLVLSMNGAPGAYGYGLSVPASPVFAAILDRMDGNLNSIRFEGSAMTARAFADQLALKGLSKSGCSVHFGLDPVSAAAATARDFSLDGRIADLATGLAAFSFPGSTMKADGRIAHNAGASEAQELAFILSSLAALLRACESGGMPIEAALAATALGVAIDQQQLLSIAKLRTLRLLHSRLQEVCGMDAPRPAHIHAETSFRMLTRLDPETNILRNTIAAFAAGVGGADSVSVLPHTLSLGLPEAFARRIARNTQLILIRECHLDDVADPAAGSGGIEALTNALAEAAWREFQQIESEGGIMASLSAGAFQRRVATMRAKRAAENKEGRRPIIGTTLYPAAEERSVEVLAKRGRTPKSRGSHRSLDPVALDAAIEGEAA